MLEYPLADARRHLKRLLAEVVSRLDMVNSLIRLIKEETSFFVTLGELDDLAKIIG